MLISIKKHQSWIPSKIRQSISTLGTLENAVLSVFMNAGIFVMSQLEIIFNISYNLLMSSFFIILSIYTESEWFLMFSKMFFKVMEKNTFIKKIHKNIKVIIPAHTVVFIILELHTFRISLGFQAVKLEQDRKCIHWAL